MVNNIFRNYPKLLVLIYMFFGSYCFFVSLASAIEFNIESDSFDDNERDHLAMFIGNSLIEIGGLKIEADSISVKYNDQIKNFNEIYIKGRIKLNHSETGISIFSSAAILTILKQTGELVCLLKGDKAVFYQPLSSSSSIFENTESNSIIGKAAEINFSPSSGMLTLTGGAIVTKNIKKYLGSIIRYNAKNKEVVASIYK